MSLITLLFLFSGKRSSYFRGTRENEHKLKEFAAFNKLYPPTNGSYNKDRNITLFLYLVCIFLHISSSLSLSLPRLMFFGVVTFLSSNWELKKDSKSFSREFVWTLLLKWHVSVARQAYLFYLFLWTFFTFFSSIGIWLCRINLFSRTL